MLSTLVDNPELSTEGIGPNLKTWQRAGINRVYDLFDNGNFKTFEALKIQYNIPY